MAFKAEKQKQNIRASQARDIERLNRLANYKAQVVQTLSSNMAHIKDSHKLLYKLDLWTQATVNQLERSSAGKAELVSAGIGLVDRQK